MKIAHVCLANFYIDNYSYQENILPKYHKKLSYNVVIIASTVSYDNQGAPCILEQKEKEYISNDGIKVIRLKYKKYPFRANKILRRYSNFYERLIDEKPDIIFLHGCQFSDILKVKRYKKQYPLVEIYVDNHTDYINSARNWLSKNILHKVIWKYYAQQVAPYVKQFWGVTPLRSEFLNKVYGIEKEKIDTLIMGVDLDTANFKNKESIRKKYRKILGFEQDDFVLISGGKINEKKNIDILINAFREIKDESFKFIIFGNIKENLEEEYLELINSDNRIIYIGWQSPKDIYSYLYASDLGIYPGTHSVLWEQTIGVGIPTIIKKWIGFHHLEINESVILIDSVTKEALKNKIIQVHNSINNLKQVASKNHEVFSYDSIARKSIFHS